MENLIGKEGINPDNVGSVIKTLREAKSLTRSDLVRAADLCKGGLLAQIEEGSGITLRVLVKLLNVLGYKLSLQKRDEFKVKDLANVSLNEAFEFVDWVSSKFKRVDVDVFCYKEADKKDKSNHLTTSELYKRWCYQKESFEKALKANNISL